MERRYGRWVGIDRCFYQYPGGGGKGEEVDGYSLIYLFGFISPSDNSQPRSPLRGSKRAPSSFQLIPARSSFTTRTQFNGRMIVTRARANFLILISPGRETDN